MKGKCYRTAFSEGLLHLYGSLKQHLESFLRGKVVSSAFGAWVILIYCAWPGLAGEGFQVTCLLLLSSLQASCRVCCRCGTEYMVSASGSCIRKEECVHHWGRLRKQRGGYRCTSSLQPCCCGTFVGLALVLLTGCDSSQLCHWVALLLLKSPCQELLGRAGGWVERRLFIGVSNKENKPNQTPVLCLLKKSAFPGADLGHWVSVTAHQSLLLWVGFICSTTLTCFELCSGFPSPGWLLEFVWLSNRGLNSLDRCVRIHSYFSPLSDI